MDSQGYARVLHFKQLREIIVFKWMPEKGRYKGRGVNHSEWTSRTSELAVPQTMHTPTLN